MEILKISESARLAMRRKSPYAMPDNPTQRGMKPDEIRKMMAGFALDETASLFAEINRIVDEANRQHAGTDTAIDEILAAIDEILKKMAQGGNETVMSTLKKIREFLSDIRGNLWTPAMAAAILSVCAGVLTLAACGAYVEGSGAEDAYTELESRVGVLTGMIGTGTITDVPEVPEIGGGGGTEEPTDPDKPTDPVVETAKLTVSGPSDGSYSVALYVQNQLGEDAGLITDWSAIPAGDSYRLAVSATGSYKITSGTVLTCNGSVVTPTTTTQGLAYVYHFTPAAGDVYALTVATEANSSGGGTEEPEVTTASLSVVSAPSDGSYSAVLYEQTESGTDGNAVEDWSAIPAGASYRLAVSANGSYKITSGTVLTCNGAVVTPYTTTQGIVYVYRFTPSAGDVYALTVATEASGSGGGESGETVTENYELKFLSRNSDATFQPSATGVETFGDGQTYTTVCETIKTNKCGVISEKITYKATKVYAITVKPVTNACRFQLAYFDASGNMTGYSTWDFGDIGTVESVFTLSGTTLSRNKGGTVSTETQTPGDATSFAVYCRTKADLVAYPDRLTVSMTTDA